MKKISVFLSMLLVLLFMVACEKDDKIKIGILQFVDAGALDDAREGFIKGLADNGFIDGENITITVENPKANQNTMITQAKKLVRENDLVLGIATPAAQALNNEAKAQNIKIPILFTAVTDPIAAGLITSNENPGDNVTGTNDMNPIEDQVKLAKELLPNATKLGIIYNTDETNSEIQANIAKDAAEALGFEVIINTFADPNQLRATTRDLAKNSDIIYIPTDNIIAEAIDSLNDILIEEKVPAVVGEENLVAPIPALTVGINYYNLGLKTAEQAVLILKDNKKPSEIPSVGLDNFELTINKEGLEAIGIEIPQTLLDRIRE